MKFSKIRRGIGYAALAGLTLTSALAIAKAADDTAGAHAKPEEVVNALYTAFVAGDQKAIERLIDEDATWTYHGPESELPFAGTRKGPEGVAEFFRLVSVYLENATPGQTETIVDGDKVAVVGWEESTVKATGGHYKVPNIHLFEVKNGKIVRFEEYIDSGTVLQAFQPADPERGRAYYTTCAGCHGLKGEGMANMNAPQLAGQSGDYMLRQLRNFSAGYRGKTEDHYGNMMVGRSRALGDDRAMRDVVAYIATLPAKADPKLAGANATLPARGKEAYQTCAVCHGEEGEGIAAVGAPAINLLAPDYIERQLTNFRTGIRGDEGEGAYATQMKLALDAVPQSEDASIAAYVATLHP